MHSPREVSSIAGQVMQFRVLYFTLYLFLRPTGIITREHRDCNRTLDSSQLSFYFILFASTNPTPPCPALPAGGKKEIIYSPRLSNPAQGYPLVALVET
jgi:hypothetical protein